MPGRGPTRRGLLGGAVATGAGAARSRGRGGARAWRRPAQARRGRGGGGRRARGPDGRPGAAQEGPLGGRARGARPRRRAHLDQARAAACPWTSAGSGSGPSRSASPRWRRRSASKTFPTYNTGLNVYDRSGHAQDLHRARSRPPSRRRIGDIAVALATLERDGGRGAARRALDGAEGARVGRPDARDLEAREH